jgi:hypothetical protein
LHQVCKCQFAASLIEQLAASLMNASMLVQVEKIRLAASCHLQICCNLRVSGCVPVSFKFLDFPLKIFKCLRTVASKLHVFIHLSISFTKLLHITKIIHIIFFLW